MSLNRAVRVYVAVMAIAAGAVLAIASRLPAVQVDAWTLFSLFFVGCILEVSRTHNKSGGMSGSLVFIFHLAGGLVVGGFWGALTAGLVKIIAELYDHTDRTKAVFNVSERVVSVGLTFIVYRLLNGEHPPSFVLVDTGAAVPFNHVLQQVLVFLVSALVYFVANSMAVNTAVAIASGRSIFSTWRANTVWVLGYDIAASSLSLGVAWLFVRSIHGNGLQKLVFLGIVLPFLFIRHVYKKLNTVQDLYNELDSAYEQLELNVREQLEMMVKAIEARDPYTSGHSRRVCGISRAIAVDLGLDAEHVELIENAALLHDVGKIHAEFAPLLQKEGKLDDEEWAIMKTHSARSAELVSLFSRFKGYVVACVRHHHERWDGRGYPDGIVGQEIPLGARIITIADTIDAMTTSRPYRGALPVEVVLAELNKCRGTQFDADLVDLTVNSVTVRRLISDPGASFEYLPTPRVRSRSLGALRRPALSEGRTAGL